MIWGMTHKERERRKKAKDDSYFTWWPVHLEDGRWAWLEHVHRVHWSSWSSWGTSGYNYFTGPKYESNRTPLKNHIV